MSQETKDIYFQSIQKAVDFIEANLKKDIDADGIAKAAHFSKFHFLRVFKAMTGETVGQYLRKRRISDAARQLIVSDQSLLQLAFDYCFESQEAFTRSFKQVLGVTPGKYRKAGVNQVAFSKARLSERRLQHLKSQDQRRPKIIDLPPKTLVGLSAKTSLSDNRIPRLWADFMRLIPAIRHNVHSGYYEVHPFDPGFEIKDFSETSLFEKWAAVEVDKIEEIPKGLAVHEFSGGKYAVFKHKGPMSAIQLSFDFIYAVWLPQSGYMPDERDDVEWYPEDYPGPDNPHGTMEIWIPIK